MSRRIAWLGPAPAVGGGVGYMATMLLGALPAAGVEVDCFAVGRADALPAELRDVDGLSFVHVDTGWQYDRWYSNADLTKVVSGHATRAYAQDKLIARIARRHAERPYAALYQFSQLELLSIRRLRRRLPAVVIHPETHAGGELRWHRREAALARRCEPAWRHRAARSMLEGRARMQRLDARTADHLVCPSRAFAAELQRDYGVDPTRCTVVPNPIDLDRFTAPAEPRPAPRPLQLLYVSRLAVRKGAEMVVALSHRLADLEGLIELRVVGDKCLWSDYRCLMGDLHRPIARYVGGVESPEAPALFRSADVLVQPSHYEPFALTVGEALASGVPVVVSDAVGAREGIDERCCRHFAAGDLDAFERAVRTLIDDVRGPAGPALRTLAREEAERAFSVGRVAAELAAVIGRL